MFPVDNPDFYQIFRRPSESQPYFLKKQEKGVDTIDSIAA